MSLPPIKSSITHYCEIPEETLGAKILDIGSSDGKGAVSSKYGDHFLNNRYCGIDIQRFERTFLPITKKDIFNFQCGVKFDTVILLHVLEHIPREKWKQLFLIINDLLAEGGYLVVNVPYNEQGNPWTKKHMIHEVIRITPKTLLSFCNFQKFKLVGRKPISEWIRHEDEKILFSILRTVKRIITNHHYSLLRNLAKTKVYPRILAVYQK